MIVGAGFHQSADAQIAYAAVRKRLWILMMMRMKKMKKTAVIMVPSIFPEDFRPHFPENLEPEKAKARGDELLADGYRITIMNDFVYEKVVFTHYVLEKEY